MCQSTVRPKGTQCPQNEFGEVLENYKRICDNVENARAKYRSSDEKIDIMAVTKTVAPEKINFAIEQGITLLGENRVQEYLSKKDSYIKTAQVHMIGRLQTNKVKYIINEVSMIQSVDSIKLAKEINRLAAKNDRTMDVLLEINIGDEASKSGVAEEGLDELIYETAQLENVRIKGLMAIPPVGCDEDMFDRMHSIFLRVKERSVPNVSMEILSMGMSGDYELAIKHGSNLVRIGTALFGARNYLEG